MKKLLLLSLLIIFLFNCAGQPEKGEAGEILLNQIGYYPSAPKVAVVAGESNGSFTVTDPDRSTTFFTGTLSDRRTSGFSNKTTRIADFSALRDTGNYVLNIPGVGSSHPFRIEPDVHDALARAVLKSYYFQRASTALPEVYAGRWKRAAGHPDAAVRLHPAAGGDTSRTFRSDKGWYDAGDYGKYIVNSGISTATLLSLYEDFPEAMQQVDLNIPESDNTLPDILDEIRWNLHWMLTMQDPQDGGVYHKMTTARFEGFVMPKDAVAQRYLMPKSTAATYDFAAVMSQAARVFRNFERQQPGFADSCLLAASKALAWAAENPAVYYDQDKMNEQFDPDVLTGAYGDRQLDDERFWAYAEHYVTTGDESYLEEIQPALLQNLAVADWRQVGALGFYRLARNPDLLSNRDLTLVEGAILELADALMERVEESPYHAAIGNVRSDFVWGSNAVAANQGISLLQAYLITKDNKYLKGALFNLDYLLGRNGTGYSFITGFGNKTPMNIHHRPSAADEVAEPIPGLLAGGPNPAQQDGVDYPSDLPDESYVDVTESYASNEIAINWNAPLVYLSFALGILQKEF